MNETITDKNSTVNAVPLHGSAYFSQALQREQPFAYLPPPGWTPDSPDTGQRWPLLVLLHGHSSNHTEWATLTRLPHYAVQQNLFIAFPNGGNGWYTNAFDGSANYEDDLIQDFLPNLQKTLPLLPSGKHWAIGGLSMGGYGAVKNALKYPGLFSVAYSTSGSLEPMKMERFRHIFGDPTEQRKHHRANNVYALAEDALSRWPTERPRILLDCGTEDERLEISRRFHQHLDFIGYRHEYEEAPGHHTWPYWNRRIRTMLPALTDYVKARP